MKHFLTAATLTFLIPAATWAMNCAEGLRSFEHRSGTACVPVDPQRIVTLHDQNALLPLMELGVEPVGSAGQTATDGTNFFRRMDGYDASAVEWIGLYGRVNDVEPVASLEPDLIVTPYWPDNIDQFQAIAPVVHIEMFTVPMEQALFEFADLVNRTDRANELKAAFEARAAEIRSTMGAELDQTTVSVVTFASWEGDVFYPANPTQAFGMVNAALELQRPQVEKELGADRVYLSTETLGNHAADAMIVFTFPDDGDATDGSEFLDHPLMSLLPQGQAGQITAIDAGQMIGSAWGKAINGLNIFAEILGEDGLNRSLVEE